MDEYVDGKIKTAIMMLKADLPSTSDQPRERWKVPVLGSKSLQDIGAFGRDLAALFFSNFFDKKAMRFFLLLAITHATFCRLATAFCKRSRVQTRPTPAHHGLQPHCRRCRPQTRRASRHRWRPALARPHRRAAPPLLKVGSIVQRCAATKKDRSRAF